jgi:hypothetical protein
MISKNLNFFFKFNIKPWTNQRLNWYDVVLTIYNELPATKKLDCSINLIARTPEEKIDKSVLEIVRNHLSFFFFF